MTTVVVTGATGFLGGHIIRALQRRPHVTVVAAARDATRLPAGLRARARIGDLTDPTYRERVVAEADVVVHAGTWSSFWGHADEERRLYLEPHRGLVDAAVSAGVHRFIGVGTVAIGTPAAAGERIPENQEPVPYSAWPHHAAMVDAERHMRSAAGSTQMVSMRLGHFVGAGNDLGLVAALVPRLRTRQVPWVDHGRAHLPLVAGEDMGEAFALAALAEGLHTYETIAVVGPEQPTAREVFTHLAAAAGVPAPAYSVPAPAARAFGALMEALHPILPGRAPFLTRALVHVGANWHVDARRASEALGYQPRVHWRDAVAASVDDRRASGFAWPELAQPIA